MLGQAVIAARAATLQFRKQMQTVTQQVSSAYLNTLRQLQRRRNVGRLLQKLDVLSAVGRSQVSVQQLLAASDYVGALELIAATQAVLKSDLRGVLAVRYVVRVHARLARPFEPRLLHSSKSPPLFPASLIPGGLTWAGTWPPSWMRSRRW